MCPACAVLTDACIYLCTRRQHSLHDRLCSSPSQPSRQQQQAHHHNNGCQPHGLSLPRSLVMSTFFPVLIRLGLPERCSSCAVLLPSVLWRWFCRRIDDRQPLSWRHPRTPKRAFRLRRHSVSLKSPKYSDGGTNANPRSDYARQTSIARSMLIIKDDRRRVL